MTIKEKFKTYINAQVARILTQMDRDPDSPTFGCFDRNYWHYKIRDFPSSLLQQGVFTIEAIRQGYISSIPSSPKIEDWSVGAINALARQIDHQGRVNEYYPFEASYPGAAFALYAACRVLFDWQQNAPQLVDLVDKSALKRLAKHLGKRQEIQASNQQAAGLAGLALAVKLKLISPNEANLEKLATELFESQHTEGWFDEYGGPDFGYLTVTIDALMDYFDATSDRRALIAIDKAVIFLAQLVGPDSCLPSTLNSRNTDYVVPYGLVRSAARNPIAAWLVETLFNNIDSPSSFLWATDDRYHLHYIFASVVRSLPYLEGMRNPKPLILQKSTWLSDCGYWIYRNSNAEWTAYVAAKKGGLVRIHRKNGTPTVDYGWRIYKNNSIWTSNWWSSNWEITQQENTILIRGLCQKTKFHVGTPAKHMILRILAFLLRNKLIPLLKKAMIFQPGKVNGAAFEREIKISDLELKISDKIGTFPGAKAFPSPRQNLRHVASADSFSREELLPSLLKMQPQNLNTEVRIESIWEAK